MSTHRHLDEARSGAIAALQELLGGRTGAQAVVVADLFGRITVYAWLEGSEKDELLTAVRDAVSIAAAHYWGDVQVSGHPVPSTDPDLLLRTAWLQGSPAHGFERLRINDRHRHHSSWFQPVATRPLWEISGDRGHIVAFYGFKGGAGRTTLLASYALACAKRGDHVVIVDVDLDAPGIGTLFAIDSAGPSWGTVDYLIEKSDELSLSDYYETVSNSSLSGAGRIDFFTTGRLDDDYLAKLARVDLEVQGNLREHPFAGLLKRIKNELDPAVILLDGRAGLSPAAGLLLSGLAHLHVLVATVGQQSIAGLERVVRHLGFEQTRSGVPQRECVVVQAHLPDDTEAAQAARLTFAEEVEDIFRRGYYATTRRDEDADEGWSLDDIASGVAPHVPVPVSYRGRLAHFRGVEQVADLLVQDGEYVAFHNRLDERRGLTSSPTPAEGGQSG